MESGLKPSFSDASWSSQSTQDPDDSSPDEKRISASSISEDSTPDIKQTPSGKRRSSEGAVPSSLLGRRALRCFHVVIFATCMAVTWVVLGFRRLLSLFMAGQPATQKLHRPSPRLSWEMLSTAEDPVALVKEVLPTPPDFPDVDRDDFTITFGPCANLMIYTGGVACCLRRCPNYKTIAPKLRFHGTSCGAFVAAVMAGDVEIVQMLPEMLEWTRRFKGRLWGLVGAYSSSISAIVQKIFSDPEVFQKASQRLTIGVTSFSPLPGGLLLDSFSNSEDLVTSVLGSCYIPVAFEVPQWSSKFGPLWDGGFFDFAAQGDVVVSPYESVLPDVYPKDPYPKCFSFFPPHEADAVALFEEGYMDCLRWLQQGAPRRPAEREATFGTTSAGMEQLLSEGRRFVLEILRGPDSISAGKKDK